MSSAFIQTFTQNVAYHSDPTAIFATLCENKPNTLLLESAEISSKNSLKSLLLVNAAMKISCLGQTVTFHALTDNGAAVLPLIAQKLSAQVNVTFQTSTELQVAFKPADNNADEDSKLLAHGIFDGLRCFTELYQASSLPVFLGGLFAYDLVANFIPMENITLQDDGITCPDYCFYLAEQLLVIDHQLQQAELQTFCFAQNALATLQQNAQDIAKKLLEIRPHLSLKPASTEVAINLDDDKFKKIIERLKQHIYCGDVFQIVPSRRFSLECPNTLATYRQLKQNNPSPYMFFIQD